MLYINTLFPLSRARFFVQIGGEAKRETKNSRGHTEEEKPQTGLSRLPMDLSFSP